MPQQIYIGATGGLKKDVLPFNIDNSNFPTMFNFYTWRGRAKRKRGTIFLARLENTIISVATPTLPWQKGPLVLSGGAGNLVSAFSLPSTSNISPGSVGLIVGANTYVEPATPDGTLIGTPAGSGTINYASGAITISGGGGSNLTGTFDYFPDLPAMGLRDFISATINAQYPLNLSFNTINSYQINQSTDAVYYYNTSFYKNSNNPVLWSGQDYQQFWTTNYSAALWATNNKPGFHFLNIATITVGNPTIITTSVAHGLITGDYVWFNEITGANAGDLNLKTFVITVTGAMSFTVAVDTTAHALNNDGIFQTLTHGIVGQDGIRWYDGDPTNGTGLPVGNGLGWVNFAPPLTALNVSIDNETSAKYYLVGALAIVPFKDRLVFFSPYIQTSTGAVIQLNDTALWSWNGTPYYASLTPTGETSDVTAYYVDQTGKGGYLPAGISQSIVTVADNEDVLLVGFTSRATRFVYTGNDIQPFLFYNINSELGDSATFSGVTLDKGSMTIGVYGIAMTDQQSKQRIDLDIPDEVFRIQSLNNGALRVNAVRDFYKEWAYFSYPVNNSSWKFPTQTFLFNYRDNTWGILYENFTAHGTYRKQKKYTWKTLPFKTWNQWREPWNSGSTSALFPSIIAGNPQGYVLIKGEGTGEGISGTIAAIANSGGLTQITSTNHCVKPGDYLLIQSMLGATSINGMIGKVISTADANTFVIDLIFPGGTYLGLGVYSRLSQPFLQTKQFPVYWDQGRQTRLCVQKYLMDYTANSQVTVNIYLSQDPDDAWNDPSINIAPNSLVYSQILYTCPESTNIGLTSANTNLQMPTAEGQYQIWHRFNTSLIGDSVQVGFTLSDSQMRNLTYATSEITLHGMNLVVDKGPHLA